MRKHGKSASAYVLRLCLEERKYQLKSSSSDRCCLQSRLYTLFYTY